MDPTRERTCNTLHPVRQCVSDWGKKLDRIFVEVTIFDYSGIPFR